MLLRTTRCSRNGGNSCQQIECSGFVTDKLRTGKQNFFFTLENQKIVEKTFSFPWTMTYCEANHMTATLPIWIPSLLKFRQHTSILSICLCLEAFTCTPFPNKIKAKLLNLVLTQLWLYLIVLSLPLHNMWYLDLPALTPWRLAWPHPSVFSIPVLQGSAQICCSPSQVSPGPPSSVCCPFPELHESLSYGIHPWAVLRYGYSLPLDCELQMEGYILIWAKAHSHMEIFFSFLENWPLSLAWQTSTYP